MLLSLKEYRNKVQGCWMGKCIGGTLGAPFECRRGVFDIEFYQQDLTQGAIPNDDLDLQLVWLNAAEKYGTNINATILAEYWLTFIIQNWSEYGASKNNLRMGLVPPLSGYVDNPNRDSCGCFIRSELWACLAPGHPEIAVRYAREDGCVDHSGDGLYSEVFFAALQSAAFACSDRDMLIDIGLSYIPADCAVAGAIALVRDCYQSGIDWRAARVHLLQRFPGSFGALGTPDEELEEIIPVGPIGWDAPSNVGITILAWLYGGDDFDKSLCIAAGCGEDADCTAGTLGAVLGIIHGIDGIPDKWKDPIADRIATVCINDREHGSRMTLSVPKTVTNLTERVLRLAPAFLGSRWCDILHPEGYTVTLLQGDALRFHPVRVSHWQQDSLVSRLQAGPYVLERDCVAFTASLDLTEEPFVAGGQIKRFVLTVENSTCQQQWLNFQWHLPDGWKVLPGKRTSASLCHYIIGSTTVEFTVQSPDVLCDNRYSIVLEITSQGRHTTGLFPIVLLHRASND